MKKLLLFLFILFTVFVAKAQIEVKQESFKEVVGFVNINEKQNDDNGTPYAVIKVRTENITDKERRELKFDGGANTSYELEYKDGEVWVYITYLASNLRILHPQFGSVSFEIPFEMRAKAGYEMVLTNKVEAVNAGWGKLALSTKPENDATISINGKVLKVKTPYNNVIATGTYEITVSKEKYRTVTKTIDIHEGNNFVEIEMPAVSGKFTLTSNPSGATVYIDGKKVGVTPFEKDIMFGEHDLSVVKEGWIIVNKRFIVKENGSLKADIVMARCPEGAINAYFSIGSKNKVLFSKGNLQYQASTKTWRFADNQYDIIGEANNNISSDNSGLIDLFGWGTGNNPTNNVDYPSFDDWGKNAISNGGDKANQWQSLDTWHYIFLIRETRSGLRYAKANVNNVNGVILLPDTWIPETYTLQEPNDESASYASNKISLSDWTDILEANGAVFLPAAGKRSGTTVMSVGSDGRYWTTQQMGPSEAIFIKFGNGALSTGAHDVRGFGFSVRLVCLADDLIATDTYSDEVLEEPVYGAIKVTSNPSGATVYIDDKACGVTPCELNEVVVGSHELEVEKKSWKSQRRQFVMEEGKTLEYNETLEKGLDGVINSEFSVSPTQKVHFSKGNLQYRASTNTWRFAEHQWDFIGYSPANKYETEKDWRDLFGWGTGKNPMNTSVDIKKYSTFSDWGKNAINNGGRETSIWRTLTKDEWVYLFDKRQTNSELRYVRATVNDVNGVILLPDSWNKKTYKFKKANKGDTPYETNIISLSDWTSVLEANGAVFLPAAGYRSIYYSLINKKWVITVLEPDRGGGRYWSSTRQQNDNEHANFLSCDGMIHSESCMTGCSVRLVCNADYNGF